MIRGGVFMDCILLIKYRVWVSRSDRFIVEFSCLNFLDFYSGVEFWWFLFFGVRFGFVCGRFFFFRGESVYFGS